MPILELPALIAAFLAQPAASLPQRPTPCAARHPDTVADCCLHFTGWDARNDRLRPNPPALVSHDGEERAHHVDLR
jgi:hypothetical protein